MSQKGKSKTDQVTRIAVVQEERCRPQKCGLECVNNCPVNKMDKKCIIADHKSKKSTIAEPLCIGCDICVKKCPFDAIRIVNLPSELDSQVSFRYGENAFKLHRLPLPRAGQVLGLVGENGTGKSTALQILKGEKRPNFGDYGVTLSVDEIIRKYRGTDLQTYFTKLLKDDDSMHVGMKIQYVDAIVKTEKAKETIEEAFSKYRRKTPERYEHIMKTLQLENLSLRKINQLSGGELQRFSIAYVALRSFDVYLIDEPSSYLDVKQRLVAANVIRELVEIDQQKYVIVVEHDLAVLDYLSDFVSLLYGEPGAYGIITLPTNCREGINNFLNGYIKSENMRFRADPIKFAIAQAKDDEVVALQNKDDQKKKDQQQKAKGKKDGKKSDEPEEEEEVKPVPKYLNSYPNMSVKLGEFELNIQQGTFFTSQITLVLGENGTGKSTFVKCIAGAKGYTPTFKEEGASLPKLIVSYKPQTISPNFDGTVEDIFNTKIQEAYCARGFQEMVIKPLNISHLLQREVKQLSGGELQRVATILALGKPADLYLIDEPSAYLDATQRLIVAKTIKRFIMSNGRCCYVVEHDFLMSLYLADRVIVFSGEPGVSCQANPPTTLQEGMNQFLKFIGITFRRDRETLRPRVNKPGSAKDKDQKISGLYYADFMDDE